MKIPKLALDYAARFNLDPVFVQGVARHLREAGLLSQGARGVNAPDATGLDAARLLIPFMVGGIAMKAKDAPEIVRDFGKLRHVRTFKYDADQQRDVIAPDADSAPPALTLEDAIAHILNCLQDSDFRNQILSTDPTVDFGAGLFVQDARLTAKIVAGDFTFLYHPESFRAHGAATHAALSQGNDAPMPMAWLPARYRSSMHGERQMDFAQLAAISDVIAGKRPIGWQTLQAELDNER